MMCRFFACCVLLCWLFALPALAQTPSPDPAAEPQTRAEALRREREKKQQQLEPNRPNGLQRTFEYIEDRGLFLVARDGLFPVMRTLTTGSGYAFGVGYRNQQIFRPRGLFDVWTAATFTRYWAVEGNAVFPALADGRVRANATATLREYPREDFFGLGPDSQRANASAFSLRFARVAGQAGWRVAPALTIGGGLGLFTPRTGPGRDPGLPSIEQRFTFAEAPGFGTRVNFLESNAFAEIDYRQPPNPRRGGFYRVDFSRYTDPDDRWTFNRTDVDLRQYLGFLAGRRVIALRGYGSTSDAPASSLGVPFYLMPWLGGNDTLRGYRNYRFRGPHLILLQAEYRWEIWSALEGALFYDTGMVALQRSDLKLSRFEDNYGFGFRFNTANRVVLRVDAAFGSRDGKHLHIALGGVF